MSKSPGYGYSPLEDDSIRLLQIEAVEKPSLHHQRSVIRCKMQHFHIGKAPSYCALSYACELLALPTYTFVPYVRDLAQCQVDPVIWPLKY
jgi:hypothetical protein